MNIIILLTFLSVVFWCLGTVAIWKQTTYIRKLNDRIGLDKISKKNRDRSIIGLFTKILIQLSEKFSIVGSRLTLFVDKAKLERHLVLAGNPGGLNLESFLGMRFVLLIGGSLLGNVLGFAGFPLGEVFRLFLPIAGFFGPVLWLKLAAEERQEEVEVALPDFLDGMCVTLQAGVPLDPALHQVVKNMEGPLSEELTRFNQEIELGVPREEAYIRLMERNECRDLETLINSLLQGSRLGVPIANTFKILAEDMRITRINKIKEKAAKASPKVTMITSFVILPSVIIGIFGLLALNFIYNPEAMGLNGIIR